MGIVIPWLQGELRVAARTAQDLRHVDFTMLVRSLRRWGFRILVGEDTNTAFASRFEKEPPSARAVTRCLP